MCDVPVQQNVYFMQYICTLRSPFSWMVSTDHSTVNFTPFLNDLCLTPPSKHNAWLTPLITRCHISHPHYAITASRPHDISVSHRPLGLAFTLPSAVCRSCPRCSARASPTVSRHRGHAPCVCVGRAAVCLHSPPLCSPLLSSFTCWSAPPCCSPSPCCPAFRPQRPPAHLQLRCPRRGSLRRSPWWRTHEGQRPANLGPCHSCWARWPRCRRSWGCCWWCSYLCCCHRHCPRRPPQRPGSLRQRPAEVSGTSLHTPPGSTSDPAQSGEKTSFSGPIHPGQQQYSSTALNEQLVKLEWSLFHHSEGDFRRSEVCVNSNTAIPLWMSNLWNWSKVYFTAVKGTLEGVKFVSMWEWVAIWAKQSLFQLSEGDLRKKEVWEWVGNGLLWEWVWE